MRIVDRKELKKMVPYSTSQIIRLEKKGLFPRHVKFGQCRVGYLSDEVEEWIASKVRERDDAVPKKR